nr:hypothetical protein KitaXyl93_16790 [Kitasatospora sp. Xyl93]
MEELPVAPEGSLGAAGMDEVAAALVLGEEHSQARRGGEPVDTGGRGWPPDTGNRSFGASLTWPLTRQPITRHLPFDMWSRQPSCQPRPGGRHRTRLREAPVPAGFTRAEAPAADGGVRGQS